MLHIFQVQYIRDCKIIFTTLIIQYNLTVQLKSIVKNKSATSTIPPLAVNPLEAYHKYRITFISPQSPSTIH